AAVRLGIGPESAPAPSGVSWCRLGGVRPAAARFGRLPVRFSPAARAGALSVMVVSLGGGGGAAPVAAARRRVAGGLPALVRLGDRLRWQVVGEAGTGVP